MLAINSIFNFFIEAITAYAIYQSYVDNGNKSLLLYFSSAIAFMILTSVLIDFATYRFKNSSGLIKKIFYYLIATLGAMVVLLGIYSGPFATGAGISLVLNGLGRICIDTDDLKRPIGFVVFLAPAPIGIYIGALLATFTAWKMYIQNAWIVIVLILIVAGILRLYYEENTLLFVDVEGKDDASDNTDKKIADESLKKISPQKILKAVVVFVIVAIESYSFFAMDFKWTKDITTSLVVSIICTALILIIGWAVNKKHIFLLSIILALISLLCFLLLNVTGLKQIEFLSFVSTVLCFSSIPGLSYELSRETIRMKSVTANIVFIAVGFGFLMAYFF